MADVKVIDIFSPGRSGRVELPLFLESVSAGFPSPADDYMEGRLDLNDFLVKNPAATFFVRVTGDSMINAGIHSGDILVVDRALDPKDGNIVIAVINGELTVKRLSRLKNKLFLLPENREYRPIE
ncbi:MAG: LexA family protein, partial [Bacteroidota bacterium]